MAWQDAMRIFTIAIAVIGISTASVVRSSPEALGLWPDGETSPPIRESEGMSLRKAAGTARFWWYFGAILLGSVGLFAALVHINPFAQHMGLTPAQANLLIGLIGVGNVVGQLLLGGVGDRMGPLRLLICLTLALSLLHVFWLVADGMTSLAVFALLFGAANGGAISLYPAVAAVWFGTKNLGAILGTLYISVGLAAIAGGSVAGVLYDQFQDYTVSIILSGLCALVSAALLVFAAKSSKASDLCGEN